MEEEIREFWEIRLKYLYDQRQCADPVYKLQLDEEIEQASWYLFELDCG